MYKNVISYNVFKNELADFTNQIIIHVPMQFCAYTGYKIEYLKLEFLTNKDKRLYTIGLQKDKSSYNIISAQSSNKDVVAKLLNKTADYDFYSHSIAKQDKNSDIFYVVSNGENNTIFSNHNDYFNMIGFAQVNNQENYFVYESNWIKANNTREIIIFDIYDQYMNKIVISNYYINIKLIYE
jgi:hypothetical protein